MKKKAEKIKGIMDCVVNEDLNYNRVILALESFVNAHSMSKNEFLKKIFIGAFNLIPEAEKGSLFELVGDEYVPVFSEGYDINTLKKLSFKREDGFNDYNCSDIASIEAYEIYIEKRDDSYFSEETIDILKELGTYSNYACLYAPIKVDGINVGLICFDCFSRTSFMENSKKLLKFYAQVISNFYTQKLYQEKQKRMYDDIVTALVSAIEVKDKYTEGHAKRVKEYCSAIGEKLELPEKQINDLMTAALLHDIGKIGVSTEILNKPGKLTEEEYSIIKKHPGYTKTILDKISGFSIISDFAYSHHENYDGTGYPRGLRQDEIPLGAQIIQVADAFDAMTSERAYRKALSPKEALEIISKEMGKQFNPEISKAALEVFSDKYV